MPSTATSCKRTEDGTLSIEFAADGQGASSFSLLKATDIAATHVEFSVGNEDGYFHAAATHISAAIIRTTRSMPNLKYVKFDIHKQESLPIRVLQEVLKARADTLEVLNLSSSFQGSLTDYNSTLAALSQCFQLRQFIYDSAYPWGFVDETTWQTHEKSTAEVLNDMLSAISHLDNVDDVHVIAAGALAPSGFRKLCQDCENSEKRRNLTLRLTNVDLSAEAAMDSIFGGKSRLVKLDLEAVRLPDISGLLHGIAENETIREISMGANQILDAGEANLFRVLSKKSRLESLTCRVVIRDSSECEAMALSLASLKSSLKTLNITIYYPADNSHAVASVLRGLYQNTSIQEACFNFFNISAFDDERIFMPQLEEMETKLEVNTTLTGLTIKKRGGRPLVLGRNVKLWLTLNRAGRKELMERFPHDKLAWTNALVAHKNNTRFVNYLLCLNPSVFFGGKNGAAEMEAGTGSTIVEDVPSKKRKLDSDRMMGISSTYRYDSMKRDHSSLERERTSDRTITVRHRIKFESSHKRRATNNKKSGCDYL